jgi:ATP synthase A1 C subunit
MSYEVDTETASAYLNSRMHGMKSRLLERAQIDAMLDHEGLQATVDLLIDSPYAEDMAEALTRFEGADAVEEAVSRNLMNTFSHVLRIAQGDLRDTAALFLGRWDLVAAKSLLRNAHHGLDADTGVASLVPGPTLSVAVMRDLAARGSVEAVAEGLMAANLELCGCLRGALSAYREEGDAAMLEETLDRSYYVENAQRLKNSKDENLAIVGRVLRMEIDRINLRMVMQAQIAGARREAPTRENLPEGVLGSKILGRMAAASSPEQAMEALGATPYAELVEELVPLITAGHFAPMERYFDRFILKTIHRCALRNVSSIAALMHYCWLKYNEVLNIRLIARGEARLLPRGRVKEEMLYA